MQRKRILEILEKYNCEIGFIHNSQIAFRFHTVGFVISYDIDNKTYSLRRRGSNNYLCFKTSYNTFKKILIGCIDINI